jgi:hypothetical protein
MRVIKSKIRSGPGIFFVLLACTLSLSAQVELRYEQNETVSWEEAILMYRWLDEQYPEAKLLEVGSTDAGRPLHLFVIDRQQNFDPELSKNSGKSILFINNGIHPGEP